VTVYAWGETGNVYTSETVVFLIGDMLQPPPSPTTSPSPTSSPTPSPKPEPKQPTPTTPPAPLPAPQEPAPPSEPVQIEPFPTTLVATSVITTTAAVRRYSDLLQETQLPARYSNSPLHIGNFAGNLFVFSVSSFLQVKNSIRILETKRTGCILRFWRGLTGNSALSRFL